MRASVLITGGAGYVGSHVVLALQSAGWPVVVIDDLSTGRAEALPQDAVELVIGDVGDPQLVDQVLASRRFAAVLHFAGSVVVPESVARPLLYYRNNTVASLQLIERCVVAGIDAFVFSSTAAVYGEPETVPVSEEAPTRPVNPYGRSKLMTETMLADAAAAHGLRPVVLRYFNVAGADPQGRAGLARKGATHLIKVACETALGVRASMPIFGHDLPTPDGTCVRDFIHVSDLADAHVRALDHLLAGGGAVTLNCGYGRGFSVREVVDGVAAASGRPIEAVLAPPRPGDPPVVIAAAERIRTVLGWQPQHDDLERIIRDALAFERLLLADAGR